MIQGPILVQSIRILKEKWDLDDPQADPRAEPRPGDDEWAAASDVNPSEDDTGEHVGGVWNSDAGAFPGPPP